jgi:hypothetical protein
VWLVEREPEAKHPRPLTPARDDALAVRALEIEVPRMQNRSGYRRAASTACAFTGSPSALGGWMTAPCTPAAAISASASSTE